MSETREQYRDILYTAYNVAAGGEMVEQYKAEGAVHDKEAVTDAGIEAVAAQVLRDVIDLLDTDYIKSHDDYSIEYADDAIRKFAKERGISLEDES